ncbi:hypothetical protein [Endozoicomonas elysicola]|uniref:Uncharacterized protein n=1 Tax=Endozoicomonas elysicola TaxID=305900 RepID=A0A081KBQ9_9GAMM|nr:hypothetical protein [Endozoicomonas elysicola]KEI71585.1 hypothetical protein GV64_13300 [Endozoicomonas elysicola]
METEKLSIQQLDASKKAIAQAKSLMDLMKTLKKKLHLSEGCGQRFLQKTNPDLALLQKAEQEIAAAYSGTPQESSKGTSKNRVGLLNNIIRRGQA